jgi:hypothetical protein
MLGDLFQPMHLLGEFRNSFTHCWCEHVIRVTNNKWKRHRLYDNIEHRESGKATIQRIIARIFSCRKKHGAID